MPNNGNGYKQEQNEKFLRKKWEMQNKNAVPAVSNAGTAEQKSGTSVKKSNQVWNAVPLANPPKVHNPTNGMVSPAAIANSYHQTSMPLRGERTLVRIAGGSDQYGRLANIYDGLADAADQNKKDLNKDFMERYGRTTDTETKEFAAFQTGNARAMKKASADSAYWRSKADDLRLSFAGSDGNGWLTNVQTVKDYEAMEKAYLAGAVDPEIYLQVAEKMSPLLYKEKYSGRQYKDQFWGQTQASYIYGKMGLDSAFAWNQYIKNPSEDNLRYAQTVDQVMRQFAQDNADTLANDATLPWISQTLAGYVPQFLEQIKAAGLGGVAGAGIGWLAGSPLPGAPIGATAGSGKLSYDMVRGAAYRTLLELGADEETARAAANDEAVLSSIVEMGDTAVDLFTLGSGAGLKAAGNSLGKQLVKAFGKYGINIGSEAWEEVLQSIISTANQNRVLDGTAGRGTLDLLGDSVALLWDALTGKNEEAKNTAIAAGKEGAKIAAMLGGSNAVGGKVGSAILNGLQNIAQQTVRPGEQISRSPASHYTGNEEKLSAGTIISDDDNLQGQNTVVQTQRRKGVIADTTRFDNSILNNLNQARLYFVEYARSHFPNSVVNKETGKRIGISRKGIDKFLSGRIPQEKYASGFHIPELIENANKVSEANNYHEETVNDIPTFEYYDSPISINGVDYTAHIRVKNTTSGDKYYGHTISVVDEIKIEPSARTSALNNSSSQPVNAIDGSKNSISTYGRNVKDLAEGIYAYGQMLSDEEKTDRLYEAMRLNGVHLDKDLKEQVDAILQAYLDYCFLDGFNKDS